MGDCDNYNGTAFSMSWTPIEDTREIVKGRLKGYRVRGLYIFFLDNIYKVFLYRDNYMQTVSMCLATSKLSVHISTMLRHILVNVMLYLHTILLTNTYVTLTLEYIRAYNLTIYSGTLLI